ncbi:hypothetical protein OF83DRAFT_532176 [Amylostereum chailletii]|nr:hypothetical protein OF83DRAFT_532176 [Amylostereum chailletii]
MARTPLRRSERLRRHSSPLSPPPSPPPPPPQTRTPPRGSPFQSHAKPCSPHTDAFPDLRRLCPGDRDVFDVVDIEIDIMDLYQAAVAREVDEPDSDLEEAEEDEDEEQDEAGRSRIAGERDSTVPDPSRWVRLQANRTTRASACGGRQFIQHPAHQGRASQTSAGACTGKYSHSEIQNATARHPQVHEDHAIQVHHCRSRPTSYENRMVGT